MILITGGAGFIGSNFVRQWLADENEQIVNLDALTYAGSLLNLEGLQNLDRYTFVKGTITDFDLVSELLTKYQPRAILNFAAESHVDRSISGPATFIETNIVGTFTLLEAARAYLNGLTTEQAADFRFLHVSTDEVYGTLEKDDPAFCETTAFSPTSPYSASKAASDHLVNAYFHTYKMNVLITNCSNNYGPYHFPEKLFPLVIQNALAGKPLPIYGDGQQVRDWLYVEDHCSAIRKILKDGTPGRAYNIGGKNEKTNLDVVNTICTLLDDLNPRSDSKSYREQIAFVADRPGHDRRYAIDPTRIENELDWRPKETFETGIRKTVEWYLANQVWAKAVMQD